MNSERWPDAPVLGDAVLPPLAEGADAILWPGLFELVTYLPADYVVVGGVMVYLHGAVAGRQPVRVTRDVDVLFDIRVVPTSLRDAATKLTELGYQVDPASPINATHRYHGPHGEHVDLLAPAGVKPRPDLTTTPPGRTIEVGGGLAALRHPVLIRATYGDQTAVVPVPDLARALVIKCCLRRPSAQTTSGCRHVSSPGRHRVPGVLGR